MNITLTNFRNKMFKLLPMLCIDGSITIFHKNNRYVILPEAKLKKLELLCALKQLPKATQSIKDIKSAIELGRM